MTIKDGLSPSFVETIAGFTAGIVSTLCLHPLDLLKTRLQVDRSSPSQLGGSLRIIREISRREGGITAFYRGLTPNIIGNSTSWALYFLCYGKAKDLMRRLRGSRVPELTSSDYFVASGLAGMVFAHLRFIGRNAHRITFANVGFCTIFALGLATSILTNPIWVIKTRMLSTGSNTPGAYASFTTGVTQIYRSEGIPGFYRGLLPALFGVSHGALQFMAYEKLKAYRTRMSSSSRSSGDSIGSGATPARQLGNFDFFLTSSLSKIFAGCFTYPYQVLRSRLQTYDAHLVYRGVRDAMTQIWAQEGFTGFYKGLGPNLLRVLPSTWVTFLVYENTKSCLV